MPKAHTKPAYTQKNPKNQKPIHLCNIESEMFLFFLSICRFGDFSLSTPWFFWVYAGFVNLKSLKPAYTQRKQTCWYGKAPEPAYTQKKQHFDAKSAQNLHILKKIKSFDSEKSPNLHILKKIKKIKNQFIYASQSHIESEIFDFFDFLEYMQVWWLFTVKTFDFFEYMQVLCTFGIKMLIFFEYMQVWCALVKIMHFLLLMQVLERYNSQNLQRVCNIEVNKAQIKTGFRFWCFVYFIIMKNKIHQNKINRMCIKHGNLQCFLSMSFNVFNTTLGSDTFPPSRGRPWGGGGYHLYIPAPSSRGAK